MAYGILLPGGLVKLPRAGGSSVPALPVWTYSQNVPQAGEFRANSAGPSGTTSFEFNDAAKYGDASWGVLFATLNTGTVLIFTDSQGQSSLFQASATNVFNQVAVQSGNWTGDYQVVVVPALAPVTLSGLMTAAGITPVADGTVNPITSLTTQTGIVTGAS